MILELPDVLGSLSPPPLVSGVAVSGLARARSVIDAMREHRTSRAQVSAPPLRDPYGERRQVFAETARVIDALIALLAFELFASQRGE